VTLFVPIVHERAPSHGPKRSKPSFSQILHPGMLGEKAPGLTAQFYCCSTRPSTWPPNHPATHPPSPSAQGKEILMPRELKVESEHIPTVECFTITSLQFHYIQRSCLPFRFAGSAALSFTHPLSLSLSLPVLYTRISVYFIYTFPILGRELQSQVLTS